MKTLTPASRPDNFLLEMELALEYHRRGRMGIYPLLIGSKAENGAFAKFNTKVITPSPSSCSSPSSVR
jgi:hypothetical protein